MFFPEIMIDLLKCIDCLLHMLALSRGAKDRKKSSAIDLQEFCVIPWRDTLKSSYPNCYIMLIYSAYDIHDSFFIHINWLIKVVD